MHTQAHCSCLQRGHNPAEVLWNTWHARPSGLVIQLHGTNSVRRPLDARTVETSLCDMVLLVIYVLCAACEGAASCRTGMRRAAGAGAAVL